MTVFDHGLSRYVVNTEPYSKTVEVECVADNTKGAYWMHKTQIGRQALCLRGEFDANLTPSSFNVNDFRLY